jgi:hypothetical protein
MCGTKLSKHSKGWLGVLKVPATIATHLPLTPIAFKNGNVVAKGIKKISMEDESHGS